MDPVLAHGPTGVATQGLGEVNYWPQRKPCRSAAVEKFMGDYGSRAVVDDEVKGAVCSGGCYTR
jgi:hypothetical protein